MKPKLNLRINLVCDIMSNYFLPLDCDLDKVLPMTLPKKDGWGGLAEGPRTMEIVVSR